MENNAVYQGSGKVKERTSHLNAPATYNCRSRRKSRCLRSFLDSPNKLKQKYQELFHFKIRSEADNDFSSCSNRNRFSTSQDLVQCLKCEKLEIGFCTFINTISESEQIAFVSILILPDYNCSGNTAPSNLRQLRLTRIPDGVQQPSSGVLFSRPRLENYSDIHGPAGIIA
ncbi:hypothetical protein NPIL_506861 [Nephila pilipes]|uniref:Uncharacterized protein n=1 Tax=Nephila pilipes TaxID=299642 RepID=A0A8X6Q6L2_NEPPI|nr:hypothetical protein NPIL_506861 [Nephila pilipes]